MRLHRPRDRHRSRGQSVVEFALVLPLMLFIFAGAADLGRLFFNYVAVENAVKEGALYGSRYPLCDNASSLCPSPNNVQWRVENEARTASNTALVTPSSECRNAVSSVPYADLRDCVAGDTYVVRATIQFAPIMPLLSQIIGGPITLGSESTAVVLNQAFDPTPGLSPTKLILGTAARNATEIAANCEQPDPVGSPNYYRSPCVDIVAPIDAANPTISAVFRAGDTIFYKVFVINNGGTNVSGVTIADTIGLPGCSARPTTMNVNASYICSYSAVAPAVVGIADTSPYVNTLSIDGNEILPTADAATVTIERPPANLAVLKFVNVFKAGGTGSGPFGTGVFGTSRTASVFFNAQVPSPSVWYKVSVENQGGRTATGLSITDSNGPLPTGTADCPTIPSSLAAGASWICYYNRPFTTAQTRVNTITATSPDSPPDSGDSDSATVTAASCSSSSNRVVPNLIGIVKATAVSRWTAAGFTTALTTWSGSTSAVVATQNRTAFSCIARTTTMAVTR